MDRTTVAFALLIWLALTFACTRRAQERVASAPMPWRAIVLAALLVGVALAARPLTSAALCGAACVALVAAASGDAHTGYLFDAVTLPAAVVVAGLAMLFGQAQSAAWGVGILVGAFGSIVLLSRGQWLGLGDVKALYTLGAAFGPFEGLVAVFAACISAILTAVVGGRFARGTQVRFGPHLAVGAAFALIAGKPIVHGWMGL